MRLCLTVLHICRYYYNKRTRQSSWEKPLELMTPIEVRHLSIWLLFLLLNFYAPWSVNLEFVVICYLYKLPPLMDAETVAILNLFKNFLCEFFFLLRLLELVCRCHGKLEKFNDCSKWSLWGRAFTFLKAGNILLFTFCLLYGEIFFMRND